MSSLPPAKRAKPTRSDLPLGGQRGEVWYEDGNVVIKVESTYFKLHRSRLSKHYGYFATLLNDPATNAQSTGSDSGPKDSADEAEADSKLRVSRKSPTLPRAAPEVIVSGCPMYELKDVRAADFTRLLNILESCL